MISFLLGIRTKVYGWLAAAGALVVVMASVFIVALRKGEAMGSANGDAEVAKQATAQAATNAQAVQQAEQVDATINQQSDGGTQKVANAAPGTPAGELRDAGWVRPTNPPGS